MSTPNAHRGDEILFALGEAELYDHLLGAPTVPEGYTALDAARDRLAAAHLDLEHTNAAVHAARLRVRSAAADLAFLDYANRIRSER